MANDIESALTEGLLDGYAGVSDFTNIERAGIQGKESNIETDGKKYTDQWFAKGTGGGQELVNVDGIYFTRLYAGGVTHAEILEELGLSAKDVTRYLKSKIVELKSQTRLFSDCTPDADGDWQYLYSIIKRDDAFEFVAGEELIIYKGVKVFMHMFMLSPIK